MADIAAKDVAALRKVTGAGMMDCKKALQETSGDMEAAKLWLREKGIAGADKRSSRDANQGAVDVVVEGNVGAIVELNCETDFVAKSDAFKQAVLKLARHVVENADADLGNQSFDGSTVDDTIKGMSGTLGEKIQLGRVVRFETPDGALDGYKHVQSERGVIGVLVEIGGVDAADPKVREVAHDVALHIANSAPRYTRREDVPSTEIDRERAVFEAQAREEGKPEQALAKVVEGKLNGFYKSVVLLEQPFVKDPKTTIGAHVASLGEAATVRRFARIKIGEE
ncbi:MAG: translation elongation factor Ts [Actinomycetia bacterium]|jgi:elongation factor Ts|nr:translation elongation factor Ts [Actinomycetes bacterium]